MGARCDETDVQIAGAAKMNWQQKLMIQSKMMQSKTIKVVLADACNMVRQGIQSLLEKDGVAVTGQASNGYDALSIVAQVEPDIVLADTDLPRLNGIELAFQIHRTHPAIGVIMLSGHRQKETVVRALKVGARAYVWKGSDFSELRFAIDAVIRGEAFISPVVCNDFLPGFLKGTRASDLAEERLTPRQRQVLQLIAEGKSNKEIAALLDL